MARRFSGVPSYGGRRFAPGGTLVNLTITRVDKEPPLVDANGKDRCIQHLDRTMHWALACRLGVDVEFGTNKIGVWGLRPQRVQGRALAFYVTA